MCNLSYKLRVSDKFGWNISDEVEFAISVENLNTVVSHILYSHLIVRRKSQFDGFRIGFMKHKHLFDIIQQFPCKFREIFAPIPLSADIFMGAMDFAPTTGDTLKVAAHSFFQQYLSDSEDRVFEGTSVRRRVIAVHA